MKTMLDIFEKYEGQHSIDEAVKDNVLTVTKGQEFKGSTTYIVKRGKKKEAIIEGPLKDGSYRGTISSVGCDYKSFESAIEGIKERLSSYINILGGDAEFKIIKKF